MQAVPQKSTVQAGRRWLRRARAAALGFGLVVAMAGSGAAAAQEPDVDASTHESPVAIAVPSGWFYPGLGEDSTGFGVRNFADGPRFLDAFTRYGGVDVMGYPSSRPLDRSRRVLLSAHPARPDAMVADHQRGPAGESLRDPA